MKKLLIAAVLLSFGMISPALAKPVEWLNRGIQAFENKQYEEAEKCFTQSVKEDPEFVEGYANLGQLYLKLGKTAQAEQNFAKLSKIYKAKGDETNAKAYADSAGASPTDASSETELNLAYLRAAITEYNNDKNTYPKNLIELVPRYIAAIPIATLPDHPAKKDVRVLPAKKADDRGGWAYVNNPHNEDFGVIFLNCSHTDVNGNTWDSR